jgi:NitT/TauT family transport system substrate-binding protein
MHTMNKQKKSCESRLWIRARLIFALVVMVGISNISCGKREQPQLERIRFRLQWMPQAQFAGYIVAKELGFYTDAKLDVEIRSAGPDLRPQLTIASGTDDIAVGVSNQVVAARSTGVPLKIIAQVFQDSANRYILKKQNAIRSLRDLRGKKVGLWTGGDEAEFISMLKTAGMTLDDVILVPQGFDVAPFLQDAYVLSMVTVYNELIQIRDKGYGDDKLQILSPADYKSAIVSDMLFATEKYLKEHRSAVQRFLDASMRGWVYCFDHPDQAVDMVVKYESSLKRDEQSKQLKAVLALIWSGQAKTMGIGYMDPEYYITAERVLFDSNQISKRVDAATVFDDSFWKEISTEHKFPRVFGTPSK